ILFWAVAGSFRCFGLTEWAARFPSALAAVLTVLLAWLAGVKLDGGKTGLRAGVILATSPLFFALARTVIFDMTLTFWITLALICFWLNSRRNFASLRLDLIAFAAMGLAALTKGPVGFLLPLIVLLVYQALAGKFAELKRLHWGLGWIVFLAVTLPWFIEVSLRNPGFPKYAFWEESLLRFTTGAHLHRSQGLLYYIPVYLGGFSPWSFFLLFAGWNWRKKLRRLREEAHHAELFLLIWAAVVFVFFTISHSKLPSYFLPALIPLSLLMALTWRDIEESGAARSPDWLTAGFAVMILLGLLMAISPQLLHFHGIEKQLARKMPASVLTLLKSSLLLGGLIVAALGFLGRNLAMRSRKPILRQLALGVVALTVPLLVLRWIAPLRNYFATFSSRTLAGAILTSPQRNLPIYGYYYFRTSLPFYLRRPVGLVTTDGDELTSNYVVARFRTLVKTARFPSATGSSEAGTGMGSEWAGQPLLLDSRQLGDLARSGPGPFLLIVQNHEINEALGAAGSMFPLWGAWKYSVWEKRPGAAASNK
ncbi:MAG TPA: glycosyltransferase family 39 protein, partial [Terriglobia bacterium]|nr:glycosyltransferase family 39 protein [Terriglobia bacterium]